MSVVITVHTHKFNYEIHIGIDILDSVGVLSRSAGLVGRGLIISDKNVSPLYGDRVLRSYEEAGYKMNLIVIEPGEAQKNWHKAYELLSQAVDIGLDRSSFIVGLGGGVIGDLSGFVASVYMRGIPIVHIPTTLLAQSDSSIGGKVAVDHPKGKNLLGAFHQPALVISDVKTLSTLPNRELMAGMAEVLKYGLIRDREFFVYLTNHLKEIINCDPEVYLKVVATAAKIKADIVEVDEKESGERMLLNFGHTAGHALEAIHGYGKYVHGEAIAIGMITAMIISHQKGFVEWVDIQSLHNMLQKLSLPTKPVEELTDIKEYLKRDKKMAQGRFRFILLESIGQAIVSEEVDAEDIVAAMMRQQQSF